MASKSSSHRKTASRSLAGPILQAMMGSRTEEELVDLSADFRKHELVEASEKFSAELGKLLLESLQRLQTVKSQAEPEPGGLEKRTYHVETYRVRPKGGADRRMVVMFVQDKDPGALLVRVTFASDKPVPARKPEMLTTQQAADVLHVSRP